MYRDLTPEIPEFHGSFCCLRFVFQLSSPARLRFTSMGLSRIGAPAKLVVPQQLVYNGISYLDDSGVPPFMDTSISDCICDMFQASFQATVPSSGGLNLPRLQDLRLSPAEARTQRSSPRRG